MDVTPLIPQGRKLIQAYGNGGFRISGEAITGSILLHPAHVIPWNPDNPSGITPDSLLPLLALEGIELLLFGMGMGMAILPEEIKALLRERHIRFERMDTGAACRTYNVLLAEERRVAAALIAV